MTTIKAAAEKIATDAQNRGWRIEQIDATLCEDRETIAFYAYCPNDDCLVEMADLPITIDQASFLSDEWRAALVGALPLASLAPGA